MKRQMQQVSIKIGSSDICKKLNISYVLISMI